MGIDLIPAQPPRGVSTIQGNFLSPLIQNLVKEYLAEATQRRKENPGLAPPEGVGEDDEFTVMERPSYIDTERADSEHEHEHDHKHEHKHKHKHEHEHTRRFTRTQRICT